MCRRQPLVATAANDTFTYSPAWMRAPMGHLTQARFRPIRRELTAASTRSSGAECWQSADFAPAWGATVPSRGFDLVCSPGFRRAILLAGQRRRGRAIDECGTINYGGDSPSWRTMRVLRGPGLRVHNASGNRAHAPAARVSAISRSSWCVGRASGALGSASPGLAVYRVPSW